MQQPTRIKYLNKRLVMIPAFSAFASINTYAHMAEDPLLTKVIIDQFEIQPAEDERPFILEGEAWVGKNFHKLWLKTEWEHEGSETEELELQALYSRAIASYWDVQIGVRQDIRPQPSRTWGAIGIQGLAPYFFDINATLFASDSGYTAARLELEYEMMLTQKWVLSPEVEINFHGQNDPETLTGSGLSDASFGLRLRYEIRRDFAPYVGLSWGKSYGNTANLVRAHGDDTEDSQVVVGLHAWF